MESSSDDSMDAPEAQPVNELQCTCEDNYNTNIDSDDDESFSRATDDTCWVPVSRLGVSTMCDSQDLVTVGQDCENNFMSVMTLCKFHLDMVKTHKCCHWCYTEVITGTYFVCPAGHNTDPSCKTVKEKMANGEERSCSHCGSTQLRQEQLQLELPAHDESHLTEFTNLIEEIEKVDEDEELKANLPRETIDSWKARLRAVAPELIPAYRHFPQKVERLAQRMFALLEYVENEEMDLIEKMVDLRGVAKPGDSTLTDDETMASFVYEGELPFRFTDVVVDIGKLTLIQEDEGAMMFCNCKDGECAPGTCDCCSGSYEKDEEGRLMIRSDKLSLAMSSISECGPACACSTQCGNRLVQMPEKRYKVELFDTGERGHGIRAREVIPPGRFIVEYSGNVRKFNDDDVTNEYCFETVLGIEPVEIDSRVYGSAARCVNHSCDPNAVIVKVAWEPVEERRLFHLAIFALEEIEEGEEITIDYGDGFWEQKIYEFACKCGSENCRHDETVRRKKIRLARRKRKMENGEKKEEDDEGDEDDNEEEVAAKKRKREAGAKDEADSVKEEESSDLSDEDEDELSTDSSQEGSVDSSKSSSSSSPIEVSSVSTVTVSSDADEDEEEAGSGDEDGEESGGDVSAGEEEMQSGVEGEEGSERNESPGEEEGVDVESEREEEEDGSEVNELAGEEESARDEQEEEADADSGREEEGSERNESAGEEEDRVDDDDEGSEVVPPVRRGVNLNEGELVVRKKEEEEEDDDIDVEGSGV